MEAQMISIEEFMSQTKTVFVIPVYQRNYDWKEDNCKQLFYDIVQIINEKDQMHFIGTVCDKDDGRHKLVIVDGQQRITTIMLLMKALYDLSNNQDTKEEIKEQYLINKYSKDNNLRIKLKPIKKDEYVYNKLINMDTFDEENFSKKEKQSNIYRNYYLFKNLILDSLNNFSIEQIKDAAERLQICELELKDENPQVIFESLNSTGLDLTNTDLLRNYFLMSLSYKDQEELYINYWLKIEEMIGSYNMEDFLMQYIIMKRKGSQLTINGKKSNINKDTLYYTFKRYMQNIDRNDKEKITECFKDLYKYASYYKNFIFEDRIPNNKLEEKLYEIFYILEEKDSAIIIMYLYDLYKNTIIELETFIKCLDISITFITRAIICKRAGLTKQFSSYVVQKLSEISSYNKLIDYYWNILSSGKGSNSLPKDNEFNETLKTKDLYGLLKSKKCKYILYKFEQFLNPKEIISFESGSIEHIMPKTLSKEWENYLNSKQDLMNHEKYLHTLGNLTLTGYNSELSNDLFVYKKEEYKKSNYSLTRAINENDWTSKQIIKRSKELSQLALVIWNIPNELNKNTKVDTGITYNLNSDYESFKGTKPLTISIFNNEKDINNWNEFLKEICDTFYKLDKLTFLELLSCNNGNIISTSSYGMNNFYEIDTGIFINIGRSTENILNVINYIANYFDNIHNINSREEIWFTLRRT